MKLLAKGFKDGKGKFHPLTGSTSDADRFKLLAKTSGKMGMKKEEFAMQGGKVVTLKEKEQFLKQKEKKTRGNNASQAEIDIIALLKKRGHLKFMEIDAELNAIMGDVNEFDIKNALEKLSREGKIEFREQGYQINDDHKGES